jgi:MFS family permease
MKKSTPWIDKPYDYSYILLATLQYIYFLQAIFGGIGFVGSTLCMATTAKFGRRPIALWSMLACSISGLLLAAGEPLGPWPNFVRFVILAFASYYGASGIVWTLLSEVFPFR